MSYTFTIIGTSSVLSTDYYPPIDLDPNSRYTLGLIGLYTYNTVPNVTEENNKFYYDNDIPITVPDGSYEISDIEQYLKEQLSVKDDDEDTFSLKPNNNTLKCMLKSKFQVNFEHKDSIGRMLGFSSKILPPNEKHESDLPVQIIKVQTIRVECSVTTSAYYDSRLSHTLYEFAPQVEPGFSINIEPQHVIYLPINRRDSIDNITLTLVDQDSRPVNFRGEQIVIRLELKRDGSIY